MRIISYLIIVFLTPAIILLNFRLLVTNQNFYQKEFEKLGVYNVVEKGTAILQLKQLIDYLCCTGQLDEEFLTQREILHLKDVRALALSAQALLGFMLVLIILISAVLLSKKKRKILLSAFKVGSIVGIGAIFVLFASSLINFDFLFLKFHLISFTNDLWLLPPESNLIKLFPQKFFQDFANQIALRSTVILVSIFLVSYLLGAKRKI